MFLRFSFYLRCLSLQAPEEQKPSVKCPECEKGIILSFKTKSDDLSGLRRIRFSIVLSKKDEEIQSSSSSAAPTSSQQVRVNLVSGS